jgi:hypothetical protein
VTAWRPLTDGTVSITVDRAREQSCQEAQHEIDFIKATTTTALCIWVDNPFLKAITEELPCDSQC